MRNGEVHGNNSKIKSGQLSVIDIDQNIFLKKKTFPVNELYGQDEGEEMGRNNHIKDVKIYKKMYEESIQNPELFWGNIAQSSLRWFKLFTKVYVGNFKKGNVSWFTNGKINACDNCVDRWVEKDPHKTAIIWEKDTPNDYKKISYQKLLEKICKIANLLKLYGVKKQDTVTIYLPMIPELVYSMLACARIGAIHNVVFAGYSAGSLCDRIIDSRSTILITCDFGLRGGKLTKLKHIADGAMDMCGMVKTCIVFKNKTKRGDIGNSKNHLYYYSRSIDSQANPDVPPDGGSGEDAHGSIHHNDRNNRTFECMGDAHPDYLDRIHRNDYVDGENDNGNSDRSRGVHTLNKIISKTNTAARKGGTIIGEGENCSRKKIEREEGKNGDCFNERQIYFPTKGDSNLQKSFTPPCRSTTSQERNNTFYCEVENGKSNFDESICTLKEGRDVDGSALMKNMRSYCPVEYMDSEDFLCILYTSGSTGKPKGVAHTTAGYLLYAYTTCKYIFDVTDKDIFGCVADIGWVTGHSYVLYGPLLNGITTVLFSSIPTYPDCGRYWNLIETHKVTQFYTAPTALRALMKHGDNFIEKYDLSSCRILGSVGEPINPETWRWYYNVVGKKKCVIVDTYWQTETGGIVIAPIPNLFKIKPGCATLPFFGIELEILDSKTLEPMKGSNVCGLLCIKSPWPGMLRTVYGNHKRLVGTYFSMCPNYYFTGDGAYRDEDGYYWISGRIDDTLNVSGHRLGAAEIEHALVQHVCIAEAAVVSFRHSVKGEGILCFVVKKKGGFKNYGEKSDSADGCDANGNIVNGTLVHQPSNVNDAVKSTHNYSDDKLLEELRLYVRQVIGPIATPDIICIVPDLPKTRSGKIIRRILRCIANGMDDFGDITTVSNYEVIDVIKSKFKESKEKRYPTSYSYEKRMQEKGDRTAHRSVN
ncbi:acetyl-CoA synthetase, putative (ACS) [Plasmodium ovale curtisi]|nr:acetyl-CoA synthetase, putative (ACS) [Plasmodium ovale curtisi]